MDGNPYRKNPLDAYSSIDQSKPVIADLFEIGEEYGWDRASVLAWLCSPTTYLDDGDGARRPVDLLETDPDRVLGVARSAWGVDW